MPDLKFLFFRTLLDWFSVWRNQPFSSILDLLDLCNFCIWYVHHCILPVYLGVSLFLISINLYYLSKKKKKFFFLSPLSLILIHKETMLLQYLNWENQMNFAMIFRWNILNVKHTFTHVCVRYLEYLGHTILLLSKQY